MLGRLLGGLVGGKLVWIAAGIAAAALAGYIAYQTVQIIGLRGDLAETRLEKAQIEQERDSYAASLDASRKEADRWREEQEAERQRAVYREQALIREAKDAREDARQESDAAERIRKAAKRSEGKSCPVDPALLEALGVREPAAPAAPAARGSDQPAGGRGKVGRR